MKNNKTVEDTHATRDIVEVLSAGTDERNYGYKTPGRYALKAIMSGFLLAIVTVFMLAIKTQFAGTNEGLVNLLGIAFSLALVLIVLTNSELLTSNFMYLTVGWYYKAITINKMLFIFLFCFIGNIIGGFILFLMKGTHIMTPEMAEQVRQYMKTVESTWLNILVKAIFCNFFINIGIYVSMLFKEGLARAFFIACGVVVFVFMGYEHVVFNAGLYAGMVFYNLDALSWLGVIKNIVFALIGNYIGGGIFIGLVYAYLNGSRDSMKAK